MNNDILILENQIVIMEAQVSMCHDSEMKKWLREQIAFTKARIRAMS